MTKKLKPMKAWADVGLNGGIYEFLGGPVADRYPHLLQIYSKKLIPGLVPVRITPIVRKSRKQK